MLRVRIQRACQRAFVILNIMITQSFVKFLYLCSKYAVIVGFIVYLKSYIRNRTAAQCWPRRGSPGKLLAGFLVLLLILISVLLYSLSVTALFFQQSHLTFTELNHELIRRNIGINTLI